MIQVLLSYKLVICLQLTHFRLSFARLDTVISVNKYAPPFPAASSIPAHSSLEFPFRIRKSSIIKAAWLKPDSFNAPFFGFAKDFKRD